ncbi:hypothetical protein EBR43_09000 [bacterium]|nr:hypothetical protein [bacterium]
MGGPVTYGILPFASTVLVGDVTTGGSNSDSGLSLAKATEEQFVADDVDDGSPEGAAKADAHVKEQVDSGAYNQSSVNRGNNTVAKQADNKSPKSSPNVEKMKTGYEDSIQKNGAGLSTKLTDNTSIGDFINKQPAIPNNKLNAIPPQMGLTPEQIACNLSSLCKNVWEPIKARYPNAVMTNALRTGSNIGAGPHGTGQAMDIQFNRSGGGSIPPDDYFAIAQWVRDNIDYDQLLLEYNTGRGPLVAWIHASIYAGTGIKAKENSRLMTFMNHKAYGVGLYDLAN